MKSAIVLIALASSATSINVHRAEPSSLLIIQPSISTVSEVPTTDTELSVMPETLNNDPIIISENELSDLNNQTINPPRLRGFNQSHLAQHLKHFLDTRPAELVPAETDDDDDDNDDDNACHDSKVNYQWLLYSDHWNTRTEK